MNDQITSAAELDALLHDLNEAGHMPKILVVDRCNIAALAWCEEVGGDDLVTGVTMAGPREDEDLIGGRDRPTSSLYFPVRIVWRPDAPTPAPAAPAMPCRTFDDLGNPICDAPAEFIVWGHLYEKRHKGPKCRKHLPPQSGVLGFGVPAIYAIPTAPATVQPTAEQVARRILDKTVGVVDCELHERLMTPMWDRATSAARAVLALFAQQPTVAEVKAEAWDEGYYAGVSDYRLGKWYPTNTGAEAWPDRRKLTPNPHRLAPQPHESDRVEREALP